MVCSLTKSILFSNWLYAFWDYLCLLGFLWHIVCFDPGLQFLKKYIEMYLHTYIQILYFNRKGLINISGSIFGTNVLMKMLLSISAFIFLPIVGVPLVSLCNIHQSCVPLFVWVMEKIRSFSKECSAFCLMYCTAPLTKTETAFL